MPRRTNAIDGRNRRRADVANRGLGRLNLAESAPTRVASGRTEVRAIAVIPLRTPSLRFTARRTRSSEPQQTVAKGGIRSYGDRLGKEYSARRQRTVS